MPSSSKLVSRVPSTAGGTWKLTEVYTGEVAASCRSRRPEDVEQPPYATARAAQREWASGR